VKKFLPLLLSLTTLYADPLIDPSSLSSTTAKYDGNALLLSGHVVLDHNLGTMHAEEASLERQEIGKDFPFSLIQLQKEVQLQLKGGGALQCANALLDFQSLTGVLTSSNTEKVIFSDTLVRKNNISIPFRLMSHLIDLEIAKTEQPGNKSDYTLDKLRANQDVIIDYANAFTLRADHAEYKNGKEGIKGIVSAFPKNSESSCLLAHEGDVVEAASVHFDLDSSLLSMDQPTGTLLSSLVPHLQKGSLIFRSKELIWDHLNATLTLKGGIQIEESSLGSLTSDGEVILTQGSLKGKKYLKAIRATGNNMLQFTDQTSNQIHTLVSHGSFLLERDQLSAVLKSPLVDDLVPEGKQIHYEESEIGIDADTAIIDYSIMQSGKLEPASLRLAGNVRIASKDLSKGERYGLADRLSYSPATQTLILAADPDQRVLFWDKEQALTVSAQEIHITQDPGTKKQSVKGVGTVKFSFTQEEQSLFSRLFTSYTGTE